MKMGTVAESLKPTFENVTREFITSIMKEILFNEEFPNFNFEFREKEAIEFIEKTLKDYRNSFNDSSFKEKLRKIEEKILETINNNNDKEIKPVMVISNYKEFFELLRQVYEKQIELYFERTQMSGFAVYEMENLFKYIWLRATPDDFNNPEEFLRKQVQMSQDTTFEKYNEEVCLGKEKDLDDNILCIKNEIARTWDENSRQIEIIIYDKKYYDNTQLFNRPHYSLPIIRYGIYEKDGKKVCQIGSIQNKNFEDEKNDVKKKIEREKYKLNKNVDIEDVISIEPKNILALSLFINILNNEGITEIEVPSIYVLDYEYHKKRGKKLIEDLEKEWPEERRENHSERYERELKYAKDNYGKEDLISEIKTERFVRTFKRLLYHYPNGTINSYPGELDSYFHLNIPVVKDESEINGDMLREIYNLVQGKNSDIER